MELYFLSEVKHMIMDHVYKHYSAL